MKKQLSFIDCWNCDKLSFITKKDVDKRFVRGGKCSGYQYKFCCPHCGKINDIDFAIDHKRCFVTFNYKSI